MGCSESRGTRPEEAYLIRAQHTLGFGSHRAAFIDQVIRKYSTGQVVNDSHLQSICRTLDIHTTNYDLNSSITTAFSTLRNPEGLKLKPLLVLGILCGTGSNQEKAQLLFEVYDEENERQLSSQRLNSLISDLLFVVVNCLGSLSGEITVQSYISGLHKGVPNYKVHLKNTLKLVVPCHKLSFIQSWTQERLDLSAEALRGSMFAVTSKESTLRLSISGLSALRKLKNVPSSAPPSSNRQATTS
jgi:Ca2+-binding EF-hand superfamily protein